MMDQFSLSDRELLKTALLTHIKSLRDILIHEGTYEGLGNENTINLSQELDQYIYLYQSSFHY
jgi:Spo0E like sporulation regulatory protein